ncbi:hypothetical protein [Musicola keenii]|uniref:hypothetical protein n=1 Tax=Musicola keenii TaxID=2884250 RepID=UPI00177CCAE9|nr:hypothetical protein [Musicola keenii]
MAGAPFLSPESLNRGIEKTPPLSETMAVEWALPACCYIVHCPRQMPEAPGDDRALLFQRFGELL